jgi:MOSC domain-containing protein YiiM
VTVIEQEVFDRIRDRLPEVEPYMRRANVMVSGLPLEGSRDRVLRLGNVRIRIHGETRPCERMDAQVAGLTEALAPSSNGGVYGVVLDDGAVRVGDDASWEVVAADAELAPVDAALASGDTKLSSVDA